MSNYPQPARIISATVFMAAGLFWISLAFKPAILAWFSLGEPISADLELAGMFVAGGLLFVVSNRNLQYALNILSAICLAGLVAWGMFGIGNV